MHRVKRVDFIWCALKETRASCWLTYFLGIEALDGMGEKTRCPPRLISFQAEGLLSRATCDF